MVNILSLKASPKILSSSISTRQHSFLSQLMMCMTVVILLVGFCSSVSSSPTPSSTGHHNKINYGSNGFMFDPNDYHATSRGDASLLSPTVRHSLSGLSPYWYIQPRARANQFLLSNLNDNEIIVPKWLPNDINNDDDLGDYIPSSMLSNKRSAMGNSGGYSNLKKRKQLSKPPMEVMNEIVNSIYLKR
jgi:hypothetical protein